MESPIACFMTWSKFWFSFSHFWFPFSHFWFSINSFISFIRKPSAKQAAEQATFQLQRPVFECSFKDMLDIIDNCRKLDYMRFPRMMQDSVTDAVDSGGNATELWSFWKGILPGKPFFSLRDYQSVWHLFWRNQMVWIGRWGIRLHGYWNEIARWFLLSFPWSLSSEIETLPCWIRTPKLVIIHQVSIWYFYFSLISFC